MALIQISHNKRGKLFLYTLLGSLTDLPKTEARQVEGTSFKYYAYASDNLNFVVWPVVDNRLVILVGRLTAEEMAKIAAELVNH